MGIRETIGKKQSLTVVAASVILVGSIIAIWVQARSFGPGGAGDAYFSVDDGKTFFPGDAKQIPPFDYQGKPAVRAHVFECGGKRVVGYVSRYTPEAMSLFAEARAARGTGKPPANVQKLATISFNGLELKRPGDTKWVIASDMPNANKIRVFRCPDGKSPSEVFP